MTRWEPGWPGVAQSSPFPLLPAHTEVTTQEWHCLSKPSLYFCLNTQRSHEWHYLSKNNNITSPLLSAHTDVTWVMLSIKQNKKLFLFCLYTLSLTSHEQHCLSNNITFPLLPAHTHVTRVTLSAKKHHCSPACIVTRVKLSLKKHITSPLLPTHIEVTWVTLSTKHHFSSPVCAHRCHLKKLSDKVS